jgi:purine-binding chemotaxis protein CheW
VSDTVNGDTPARAGLTDDDRELLRRRARQLARVPRPDRRHDTEQMILFRLGDERFAIDASCVLQVAVLRELTPLPGAPAPLFGVTHWRGEVLTVLDLRGPLGVQVHGLTDLGRVLVMAGPDRRFGVLADAVTDMVGIDPDRIQPLPEEDAARGSLLRGVADDALLVLDGGALLTRFGSVGREHNTPGGG